MVVVNSNSSKKISLLEKYMITQTQKFNWDHCRTGLRK